MVSNRVLLAAVLILASQSLCASQLKQAQESSGASTAQTLGALAGAAKQETEKQKNIFVSPNGKWRVEPVQNSSSPMFDGNLTPKERAYEMIYGNDYFAYYIYLLSVDEKGGKKIAFTIKADECKAVVFNTDSTEVDITYESRFGDTLTQNLKLAAN